MSYLDAGRLDRLADQDSVIHRLDPRAKVLASLIFITLVVSHPPTAVAPLLPYLLYPLTLAILGFMPLSLLARRVLIALPFVALVGIWNPLLDRSPGVIIAGVTVSRGWLSFASILTRGLLCVLAALTLAGSTPFPRLIQALRALRVPRALTVQLMILYRYLFLLIGEAQRMRRARALRGGRGSLRQTGAMLSALLLRTLDRGDAIWRAMKARGFEGELKTIDRMQWRPADTLLLLAVAAGSVILRIAPVTELAGRLVRWP